MTSGLPLPGNPSLYTGQITVPVGYHRIPVVENSYADWLRQLPLKAQGTPVRLFNGTLKKNQTAHFAVLDLDVGDKDLQQCADAIIRLRAEYLYSRAMYAAIHFNFTSGDRIDYLKWAEGYRPLVINNQVQWLKLASKDTSYPTFRKYLLKIFQYAGTASLAKELKALTDISALEPGDVFIRGGSPGHAILVIDVAIHDQNPDEKIFLLAQSFMPAQDIHILKNPTDDALTPWYKLAKQENLQTPEWTFFAHDLKRFP